MSHSSPPYYPTADYAARNAPPRTQSAASVSRHLQRSNADYTLVHAGRQVRIGPVAFWIVVGTLVVMAVWSITTGTYFTFRENVLTRLIGRQAEMQFAYEDRIAELRAQVDRITSRQLLDQEQFEQKLNGLLQRQSVLEQRSSALAGDLGTTGSIRPQHVAPPPAEPVNRPIKASPISDTVIYVTPPDREARLESRELPESTTRIASRGDANGLYGVLARVSASLDKVDKRQSVALTDLEEHVDSKARRMRSVLADLGVDPRRLPPGGAAGGPFVPLKAPHSGASAFERQLYRINVARAEIGQYANNLVFVPVRKPVTGEVDMSSPFGVRMDPFLGRPAMHSGIDLRGEIGEPVHATADGRVTIAGRDGGYGNMVEIDHGSGLATRYGHLSEIDVKVGQRVRIGETIGKIGSTGRSTGPHLHYETRFNGEAVDPQKFLRAGIRLGSALQG
jgi:murein DD-endopeptidase MepM/ murein hydrolase activator NlpD